MTLNLNFVQTQLIKIYRLDNYYAIIQFSTVMKPGFLGQINNPNFTAINLIIFENVY